MAYGCVCVCLHSHNFLKLTVIQNYDGSTQLMMFIFFLIYMKVDFVDWLRIYFLANKNFPVDAVFKYLIIIINFCQFSDFEIINNCSSLLNFIYPEWRESGARIQLQDSFKWDTREFVKGCPWLVPRTTFYHASFPGNWYIVIPSKFWQSRLLLSLVIITIK